MSRPIPGDYQLSFLVIGAMRSGTTTLYEHLRSHPQLWLPDTKEHPYFSHDNRFREPWERYAARHFPAVDPGKAYGIATAHGMAGALMGPCPAVSRPSMRPTEMIPARIASHFPDARLVAILRDPVSRAVAHCRMMIKLGLEPRGVAQALHESLDPDALQQARIEPNEINAYLAWGEYDRILQGYLQHFPRERLLVLSTVELQEEPAALLSRVFRFLGVDDTHLPADIGAVHRPRVEGRRIRSQRLIDLQRRLLLSESARSTWHRLPTPLRKRVWHGYNNAAWRAGQPDRTRAPGIELPSTLLQRLTSHFEPDSRALQNWAGEVPGLLPAQVATVG